ncbi:7tm 6 domain containing protein, partial [Asbolus verrucosus]
MGRFDWQLTIKMNISLLRLVGLWPNDDVYKMNFYTLYATISTNIFISAHIVSTCLLALGDCNIDMLVSALMMFLGAQCDILCDDLKNLGSVFSDFNKEIKRCVRHHKEILRSKILSETSSDSLLNSF